MARKDTPPKTEKRPRAIRIEDGGVYISRDALFKARRLFLKGSLAVGALAAEEIIRASLNPEMRVLMRAWNAREKLPENTERMDISVEQDDLLWVQHFRSWSKDGKNPQDRTDIITDQIWPNISNNLQGLAQLYYERQKATDAERKLPPKEFFSFYRDFLLQLHITADTLDIDFVSLVVAMQVSGANIGGVESQNKDVEVSRKQASAGAVAHHYRHIPILRDVLGPDAVKARVAGPPAYSNEARQDRVVSLFVPTIGMHDIEPELTARGVFESVHPDTLSEFVGKNPLYIEAVRAMRDLLTARAKLDAQKNRVRQSVNTLLNRSLGILDAFFDPATSRQAFAAIGIAAPLSDFHTTNYTRAWKHFVEHMQSTVQEDSTLHHFAAENTMREYFEEYARFPGMAQTNLFRDNILNPKFISYLRTRLDSQSPQAGNEALAACIREIDTLDREIIDYRAANLNAYTSLSCLEYDAAFQIFAGTAYFKMLHDTLDKEKIFDGVLTTEKDKALLPAFGLIFLNEVGATGALAERSDWPTVTNADMPYNIGDETRALKKHVESIKGLGVLKDDPWGNYNNFMEYGTNLDDSGVIQNHPAMAGIWPNYAQNIAGRNRANNIVYARHLMVDFEGEDKIREVPLPPPVLDNNALPLFLGLTAPPHFPLPSQRPLVLAFEPGEAAQVFHSTLPRVGYNAEITVALSQAPWRENNFKPKFPLLGDQYEITVGKNNMLHIKLMLNKLHDVAWYALDHKGGFAMENNRECIVIPNIPDLDSYAGVTLEVVKHTALEREDEVEHMLTPRYSATIEGRVDVHMIAAAHRALAHAEELYALQKSNDPGDSVYSVRSRLEKGELNQQAAQMLAKLELRERERSGNLEEKAEIRIGDQDFTLNSLINEIKRLRPAQTKPSNQRQ